MTEVVFQRSFWSVLYSHRFKRKNKTSKTKTEKNTQSLHSYEVKMTFL